MPSDTPPIRHIAVASFIGTAIEFYDFYIYAMAAALVIGPVFFPQQAIETQTLQAFLTFAIAFIARPVGAALFGHIGDTKGRKTTLAASLFVMGLSTLAIGLLPSYASIGLAAPILLCLLRFGQGLGLGGEWGGAALLATEFAPSTQRFRYGMFPQLGPSIGFLFATLSYLGLTIGLSEAEFLAWGWRVPFLLSALLVVIGLYVRIKLSETPQFQQAIEKKQTLTHPLSAVIRHHTRPLLLGALAMVVCYNLFYTATVFCLSYATNSLGLSKITMLEYLAVAVIWMAIATPISAWAADRFGATRVLIVSMSLAVVIGGLFSALLQTDNMPILLGTLLGIMGLCFAPMGAWLPARFPVEVRYTGAGLAYQLGGILGASLAPAISQWLVSHGQLVWVGMYISLCATVSLMAVVCNPEAKITCNLSTQN